MSGSPLIQIEDLKKYYPVNKGIKDIFNKEKKICQSH